MTRTYYVTVTDGAGQPSRTWSFEVEGEVAARDYARDLADRGYRGGTVALYAVNPAEWPSDAVELYGDLIEDTVDVIDIHAYYDYQDPRNVGWAWRTDSGSGPLDLPDGAADGPDADLLVVAAAAAEQAGSADGSPRVTVYSGERPRLVYWSASDRSASDWRWL